MSRKMFNKSRPARDALNKAGGIMDSSPELMQEVQGYPVQGVQNFANGSNVRIPGQTDKIVRLSRDPMGVNRLGGYPYYGGKNTRFFNKSKYDPEYARKLAESGAFGEGGRKFIDQAAGGIASITNAASGVVNDVLGGAQSVLGFDDAAIRSEQRSDDYYDQAKRMLMGEGLSLSQNPDNSLISGIKNDSDSIKEMSFITQPFGDYSSPEELAGAYPEIDVSIPAGSLTSNDEARLQDREAALYGPTSGMNDYLARIQEDTDKEKFERLRRTAAPATKEAIAREEAKLKKIKDDETAFANDLTAFGGSGSPISSAEEIKKQVQSTVINGSPQEKQKDLKQLMAEFTDNAPKYEGMNKGLAIAKIGFAIAAGQSPNAMTNIARGLSQGADEFIKDKANRDAFDRQLKLTALQYGLGEQSKIDTQRRADDRKFFDFVATEDGSFKGVPFKKRQNIRVSMTDIIANGGKLPAELQNQELYLSGVEAVNERSKLVLEAADNLRKERIIKDPAAQKYKGDYTTASSNFKSAERGVNYLETALIGTAEDKVTGGTAALKDLLRKGGSLFGIKVGKEYKTLDEAKTAMSIALQPLIKVTLGETQSANSISNRDVEFLIKAVYGDDALSKNSFSLATADSGQMIIRLKGAIKAMRAAQAKDLNTMKTIEDQLVSRILPGQGEGSGMTLIRASQRDVEPFLPGGERTAKGSGLVPAEEPNTFNIVFN